MKGLPVRVIAEKLSMFKGKKVISATGNANEKNRKKTKNKLLLSFIPVFIYLGHYQKALMRT